MIDFKQYNLDTNFVDIVGVFRGNPKNEESEKINGTSDSRDMREDTYWESLTQDEKDEFNKERSLQRTKTKVRRLVISQKMKYMWTLTFAAPKINVRGKNYDMGNLDDVWVQWKSFIKRCERAGLNMKYIVTVELQEKRKEKYGTDVYHFHFATDTFIPFDSEVAARINKSYNMKDLWIHGYALASGNKKNSRFAHLYLMKYISKMFDTSAKGTNRYRCSQGMVVPVEIKEIANEMMLDIYVNQVAKARKLEVKKEYYPLCGGEIEVLVYLLAPYKKKILVRTDPQQNNEKKPRKKEFSEPVQALPVVKNASEVKPGFARQMNIWGF